MKIMIDILHPAHVHLFKNFIWEMQKKDHKILITAREKDVTLRLLDAYEIKYAKISKISKSKIGLLAEFISRNIKFYKIAKKFKPDVLMGAMGPTIALVGFLIRIPRVVFYNNETAKLTNFFVQPLATAFVTSTSYEGKVKGKHITHNSYHELAYLHPRYFEPNKEILKLAKLENQKFFIVRFVSWESSHDIGGRSLIDKIGFIKSLERYGKVVITSEKNLPNELKKYQIKLPPEKMHDLLAYATLCIGESATMAAEAALLGVPAIYIANTLRGYINELEKDYQLVFNFKSQKKAMQKALKLLKNRSLKNEWLEKRDKMLKEKTDLTEWMIKFIEKKRYLSC
jgi:predicted glycosyltransferase